MLTSSNQCDLAIEAEHASKVLELRHAVQYPASVRKSFRVNLDRKLLRPIFNDVLGYADIYMLGG